MTFCPSCGVERKEGSKFCHNCGYDFEAVDAVTNENANTNTNIDANMNSNSDVQVNQNPIPNVQTQNSYTISKILGYLCAILIPILGIIFGIYLYTRDEDDAKMHGKIMIGLSILIWFISFLAMGS